MAVEKISYKEFFIGTDAEKVAMNTKGIVPGSEFYCYDTKATHVFASGAWRAKQ